MHTQHAEPRGALRQLTPLVVFIFQGLPRHHVRLRVASYESCRDSCCTQATYESTLSPTHLMQQLLAFVHPLLKLFEDLNLMQSHLRCRAFVTEAKHVSPITEANKIQSHESQVYLLYLVFIHLPSTCLGLGCARARPAASGAEPSSRRPARPSAYVKVSS